MSAAAARDDDLRDAPSVPPTPAGAPSVSVVVASSRSAELLAACLDSLIEQCRGARAELIVARPADAETADAVFAARPSVRVVITPSGTSVPMLRATGMRAATGDIVALTEDNCVADPNWMASLAQGVAAGADVVGGGVDNGKNRRAVDWAAYFAEYGIYSSTRAEGSVPKELITAANVAYSRAVVNQVIEWAALGEREYQAHRRLGASGREFRFVRTAAVHQNATIAFWPFCVDRYEHGRDYARNRLLEEHGVNRWVRLLGCPLLPVVLTARIARVAGHARVGAFIRALPTTLIFMTAWSLGEAAGYMRGAARQTSNPAPTR